MPARKSTGRSRKGPAKRTTPKPAEVTLEQTLGSGLATLIRQVVKDEVAKGIDEFMDKDLDRIVEDSVTAAINDVDPDQIGASSSGHTHTVSTETEEDI